MVHRMAFPFSVRHSYLTFTLPTLFIQPKVSINHLAWMINYVSFHGGILSVARYHFLLIKKEWHLKLQRFSNVKETESFTHIS